MIHAAHRSPRPVILNRRSWLVNGLTRSEQILGELAAHGRRVEPYFFRTSDGHEIDLVLDFGNERWAIEVKLSASPTPSEMDTLDCNADLIGATRRYLVSHTPRSAGTVARASCSLTGAMERIAEP